ncbi:NADPH2:quinone reductase [Paenibacillus taihuensis]|uniref:NADPH2:quinone reductase n=1 Tax=Paenibacillus taihuensis TaxID=1156355 RepID=A0A3D9S7A6_9BACL|nr:zinc-binding dehydrogenase [Paenibacillus taihuensis]REE89046.1 NADPH2:quinone reductase [Paenibacillus taihuensis]
MKAIIVEQFGGTEHLKLVDMETPTPGPGQVLIRVKTTSVNFADIKARYGNKGAGKLPFIPGLEAAGVVEQVGKRVSTVQVGQRVLAFPHNGSYAEYIIADANLTFSLPDEVTMEAAGASGIVTFLSYKLLADLAKMEAGETVVVHSAAGGVGTTAIQVAKALSAGMVIGTVGTESKMPVAYDAGADHVLCYADGSWVEQVSALTGGTGSAIILDSVGGAVSEQSLACLAKYGRFVVFGNSSGTYAQLSTGELHASCRSILGYSLGTTRKERPEQLQAAAPQVFQLLASGKVRIKINEKLPLESAAQAQELVETRASTGKVLLVVEE